MKYVSLLIMLLVLTSCEKDNKYIIAKNQLGNLNNSTKIHQIESLLQSDSVVKVSPKNAYGGAISSAVGEVKVFNASAPVEQILSIKPHGALDSLSHIKSIRILSDRYKTKNGITIGSSFAEVKKHHNIDDIQSSLKSIIISLEDLNAFVSFDRKVLPGEVRFDLEADIKSTMIPNDAKINRFWLNFEAEENVEE